MCIRDSIKAEKCRQFDLEMESNEVKAMILINAFFNEQDLRDILNYKYKIMAITTDDIKRVAKKYLSDNYLALYIEKGKPDTNAKIEKPGYKPVAVSYTHLGRRTILEIRIHPQSARRTPLFGSRRSG